MIKITWNGDRKNGSDHLKGPVTPAFLTAKFQKSVNFTQSINSMCNSKMLSTCILDIANLSVIGNAVWPAVSHDTDSGYISEYNLLSYQQLVASQLVRQAM